MFLFILHNFLAIRKGVCQVSVWQTPLLWSMIVFNSSWDRRRQSRPLQSQRRALRQRPRASWCRRAPRRYRSPAGALGILAEVRPLRAEVGGVENVLDVGIRTFQIGGNAVCNGNAGLCIKICLLCFRRNECFHNFLRKLGVLAVLGDVSPCSRRHRSTDDLPAG